MPKIKEQRKQAGFSVRAAANAAGMRGLNYAILSNIERGQTVLASKPVLMRLCELYNCTPADLYDRKELYTIPSGNRKKRTRLEFQTDADTLRCLSIERVRAAGFCSRRELLEVVARLLAAGVLNKRKATAAIARARRKKGETHV